MDILLHYQNWNVNSEMVIKVDDSRMNEVLTGTVEETDKLLASLVMDQMKEFHLRSVRELPFIAIKENSGVWYLLLQRELLQSLIKTI